MAQELTLPSAIHLAAVVLDHGTAQGRGFSVIHLLSVWVLISLACAIWFIRRGNVRAHKGFMVGVMFGLVGAGIGALTPGRFLTQLLF